MLTEAAVTEAVMIEAQTDEVIEANSGTKEMVISSETVVLKKYN